MNWDADLVGKGSAIATERQTCCCDPRLGGCWTPDLWRWLEVGPTACWGRLFTEMSHCRHSATRPPEGGARRSFWPPSVAGCCVGVGGPGEAEQLVAQMASELENEALSSCSASRAPSADKTSGPAATYLKGSDSFSLKHSSRVTLGLRGN